MAAAKINKDFLLIQQWRWGFPFVILLATVTSGIAMAQVSPAGSQLAGSKPAPLATFEVKVRDLYTGYAVPAEITIKPRVPEPAGEVTVQVPHIPTGPADPGKLLFKRGGTTDPTANSEVDIPDASPGPPDPNDVLSKESTAAAQQETLLTAPLTVKADMNGPTLFSLAPGVYDLSESAKGYEPGTAYFTAEPGATLDIRVSLRPLTLPERLRPEVVTAQLKPGFSLFHGHVVDAFSGQPLAGVFVRLAKHEVGAKTDDRGYFFFQVSVPELVNMRPEDIATDAPSPADDLIAELPGYKQYRLVKTLLFGQQFVIDLERGQGVTEINNPHRMLAPPVIEEETPLPSGLKEPTSSHQFLWEEQSSTDTSTPRIVDGIAQHPTRQIVVGFNNCGSLGKTCTSVNPMPMEDYVRAGLNEEWLISWTKNAFKAGAVAYRTYAAYRMYLRDIGQPRYSTNYDLCNTSVCQANDFNNPNPEPTIYRDAIAETKGIILTVDGTLSNNRANAWRIPADSEYALQNNGLVDPTKSFPDSLGCTDDNPNTPCWCTDGDPNTPCCKASNNSVCSDGQAGSPNAGTSVNSRWPCISEGVGAGKYCDGHGRGMSQRGSRDWALQGQDWKWILNHYYNNNGNPDNARSMFFATEAERRVARGAEGRLHAFMQGTDSAFWYRAQTIAGNSTTYSGWTSLGGCLLSTPVSAVTTQGQIEVFGQGCDTGLWRNTLAGWNRIDLTGGAPAWLPYEEPDVARDVNGRLHLFMRDTSGIVWRGNPQGNGNYLWSSLGGPAMAGPAEVIRHANTAGSFQLFAPGYGDVWTAYQVSPPQFSGFSSLGHPLVGNTNWYIDGNPFPVLNKNKRWELFVVACSQVPSQGCSLWTRRTTVTGPGVGGLTAWTNLGGNFISDCDGAINGAGGLHIFAVGSDRQMYTWYQTTPESPNWTGIKLPAPSGITWTSVPSVLRNADGRLEVFARGSDAALWYNRENSPLGTWAGWQSLGGGVGGF